MLRSVAAAALLIALAYIVHLRRELGLARSRGDMYRDIAAQLDRQRANSSPSA
ncbi:MAG TPA: hypothetical protein VFZ66_02250 [Herpetosiphonaceae bacterium]